MSGRGRGRGRSGFTGRGRRKGRLNSRSAQQKTESKKMLHDYTYYVGSSKQASDYHTITKYIMNHIRKTFPNRDDIANALERGKATDTNQWRPTLKMSAKDPKKDAEKADHARETKENKIIYKAQVDSWMCQTDHYHNSKSKA